MGMFMYHTELPLLKSEFSMAHENMHVGESPHRAASAHRREALQLARPVSGVLGPFSGGRGQRRVCPLSRYGDALRRTKLANGRAGAARVHLRFLWHRLPGDWQRLCAVFADPRPAPLRGGWVGVRVCSFCAHLHTYISRFIARTCSS